MTSCYPGRRMRWSGVTDAIARCKNRSIGYARKPRSAHAWRWTCGEKPKRQGATKPSTPYMRHVLPEATRSPCDSRDTRLHYCPTFEALTNKVEQALLKFANIPEDMLALCSLPTELAQAA